MTEAERDTVLDALLDALHADARVCGHEALNVVAELGKRGYRIVPLFPTREVDEANAFGFREGYRVGWDARARAEKAERP